MTTRASDPRPLILWTIAMALLGVVALYAIYLIREVLLLLYVSGIFAIGFSPIVRWIERQRVLPIAARLPRWLAILILYLVILGALAGIAALVFPPLISQARAFWEQLPELVARGQTFLIERGFLQRQLSIQELMQRAPVVGGGGDTVGRVIGAAWGFFGGIMGLATILILTFYLLVEAESIRGAFLRLFPRGRHAQVTKTSAEATLKVSAWLNGQLLLASIIGITAAIGLWLIGVPYFYVLALIAALGEMIPIVGPILAAIPAIAVASSVSGQQALFVAIFFIVQQQLENHVLVPKIMERQVGISPAVVIIALLIGGSLLGVMGAILAVPTAAIIQVIYLEFERRHADGPRD
ncbi:MAG: AI-2E family transporter [Acidobacteria bacterium]|nr:AI-2E family transporter [Acidobacteriota bacterium]